MTQRKIPKRKCVVTNETRPKKEMIRIVRNKELEVAIDRTGKMNGRGAYITMDKAIIEKAIEQHVLERTLKVKIDESLYVELRALVGERNHEG